jgi:PAS domain S-box-containing protein
MVFNRHQQDVEYALQSAKQQVTLLRMQAAAGAVDADQLASWLEELEWLLKQLADERKQNKTQEQLATLYRVSRLLGSSLDQETVLEQVMDAVLALTGAEHAVVMLLVDDELEVKMVRGASGDAEVDVPPISETISRQVIETNEPVLTTNALKDPRFSSKASVRFHNLRSIMAAPLPVRGRPVGVVYVDNRVRDNVFTKDELALLEALAQQAAAAIENARLFAELLDAREQMATILNNSPDAFLLLETDSQIREVNAAFYLLFGYERFAEVQKLSIGDLVNLDTADLLEQFLADAVRDGAPARMEVLAKRKDGTTFDADIAITPVQQGEVVTNVVCCLRDISAAKSAERSKDLFVSSISHELRTPIASLKLYRELLERSPDRFSTYMNRLQHEIDRLHRFVEDVIYLARMDQDIIPQNVTALNLNVLAHQCVTDWMPAAEAKALALGFVEDASIPAVRGDAALLRRVINVLLTNAINYTPQGGEITVRAGQAEFDGQVWAGVSVSDTGPGIPPEEQPRIFERFYRGHIGVSSYIPGAGLGLSIAYEIIARHNGRITVESTGKPGKGSTFCVWLPAGN